jgi:adenosylmethionine-8-amino-7-oxononanoate aminotransferase
MEHLLRNTARPSSLPRRQVELRMNQRAATAPVTRASSGGGETAPPASRVFHRFPKAPLPRAAAGDGPYIVDETGKRYLDASGGAAVSCLGHSHPAVVTAIQDQVGRLAFAHTTFFTSEPMEELADLLVAQAPGDLGRVYFTSGGSEGVEAALKLARQYFVERGETRRTRIVARRQSYHGSASATTATSGTSGAAACSGPSSSSPTGPPRNPSTGRSALPGG